MIRFILITLFFCTVIQSTSYAQSRSRVQVKPGLYIYEVWNEKIHLENQGGMVAIAYSLVINNSGYSAVTFTNCNTPGEGYVVSHTIKEGQRQELPAHLAEYIKANSGDPLFDVIDYYCFNKNLFAKDNKEDDESAQVLSIKILKSECVILARTARTALMLKRQDFSVSEAKKTFSDAMLARVGEKMVRRGYEVIDYVYKNAQSPEHSFSDVFKHCADGNGLAKSITEGELSALINAELMKK